MSKVTTAFFMMAGISLIFYLFGLIQDSNSLINIVLNPQELFTLSYWLTLQGAITGAGLAAGVIIGIVSKNIELTAMIGAATFMFNLFMDFGDVIATVYAVGGAAGLVLSLIFFSVPFAYTSIAVVDWWRGRG